MSATTGSTSESRPIDANLYCLECGYNLRGLVPEERCPECGTFVTESLRQTIRPGKRREIRDWLIWLAAILETDPKLVTQAACDCARFALSLLPADEEEESTSSCTSALWQRRETDSINTWTVLRSFSIRLRNSAARASCS